MSVIAQVKANQTQMVTIGVLDRAPYILLNEAQQLNGQSIADLKRWLKTHNTDFKTIKTNWKRGLLQAERSTDLLLMPMSRTTEREESWYWLYKLYSINYQLLGINNYADRQIQQLAITTGNLKTACFANTIQCDLIKKLGFPDTAITEISALDSDAAIKMLVEGRIDILLDDKDAVIGIIEQLGLDQSDLNVIKGYSYVVDDYLVAKKDAIDDDILLNLMN